MQLDKILMSPSPDLNCASWVTRKIEYVHFTESIPSGFVGYLSFVEPATKEPIGREDCPIRLQIRE